MNRAFRLKLARQKAEALLKAEGLKELPIDPFAIAASRDILVEGKPDTAAGVSGMLMRHGNSFGIMYATNIDNEGFQRFSVCHELGHYFLEGHVDHLFVKNESHSSFAGFVSNDPYEQEADSFAVGMLMPAGPVKRLISRNSVGFPVVQEVASQCKTSLTASAIRYSELTSDAVAIVISTGPTIDYCCLSEAMKTLPQLTWLRRGGPVPKGTATAHFNRDEKRIVQGARVYEDVDIMDWLGGTRSAIVTEEVIGLGSYGRTLTILSSDLLGHEDDVEPGDDDDELDASWKPKFR